MLKLLVRFLFGTLVLLAIFTSAPAIAGAKHKDSPCDKPREIASRPQLSKEDQAKARKIMAQGYVNISISEEGDVIDAKVVQASSPEAVDLLPSSHIRKDCEVQTTARMRNHSRRDQLYVGEPVKVVTCRDFECKGLTTLIP